MASDNRITHLAAAAGRGEAGASEELLPLVYEELRKLARSTHATGAPWSDTSADGTGALKLTYVSSAMTPIGKVAGTSLPLRLRPCVVS